MQEHSTTVVQTAACDMGRCGSCRGVVLSLTTAHLTDCACPCHEPEPVDVDELERIQDLEEDRLWDWSL